jgi:hypothetical protein
MNRRFAALLAIFISCAWVGVLSSPAAAQEKPKTETAAKEMSLARAVVGTGVENMEPVGAAGTFPAATEKVFCFVEINNIPKDTELSFAWFQGDKEVRKISVPVKAGPKWRTWTNKNLGGQKGGWKVQIKDGDGKVLGEVQFKVE